MLGAALVLFLAAAGPPPGPSDYRADAQSIERLINEDYAYLDRFPDGKMPTSAVLRVEAAAVDTREELIRYAERALAVLADHHAITGSSLKDGWGLVPSYADLWVERHGGAFVVTAVRPGSPAARSGARAGDHLLAIKGIPTHVAVDQFWTDLGLPVTNERASYAARVLAAGRRSESRRLTLSTGRAAPQILVLPNLYQTRQADRPTVSALDEGPARLIRIHDSLGNNETIKAFDAAMATVRPGQAIIIDLTDTPSGGNTTVARGVLGWFVTKPTFYQMHSIPAEERRYGVARQWIEQVLPRAGKQHRGPVTVRVGRWTGSMGEGLAIGFDAIGARVEGDRMAGLLGAIYDYKLERTGMVIKFPVERLFHVNGTPREQFVPAKPLAGRQ